MMMNINGQGSISMNLGGGGSSGITIMDDMSEPSSPESTGFDDTDLLQNSINDDVSAQLAAAGPVGVAAAAAIASGKKRKRPHSFETNPSIRKRQQTRLLRKLKSVIEEYTTRVGQQAILLCVTPGRTHHSNNAYRVFGSQPLESVVRNCKEDIMRELEQALASQAPPQAAENSHQHELPALVIDGIPTPLDKMTQGQLRRWIPTMLRYSSLRGKPHWGEADYRPVWWPATVPWANVRCDVRTPQEKAKAQLRAFIPEMLKYSTSRSKPGWGKPECCPVWWPDDVPWANVRSDVRTEEEKKKVTWTQALRSIVRNCYRHHGREDLMPDFSEDPHTQHAASVTAAAAAAFGQHTMVQTINNPDGTMSIIHIDTGDGSPQIVTLADGTQAQVVHAINPGGHEANQAVQTLSDVAAGNQQLSSTVTDMTGAQSMATLAEATINQDGQIIITGDAAGLGSMVSIPVSVYQTVVTSMAQLSGGDDGEQRTVQISMTPLDQDGGGEQQQQQQYTSAAAHIKEMDSDQSDGEQQMVVATHQQVHQHMQQQQQHVTIQQLNKNNVPDATQAVEVMTVEPELKPPV